MSGAETRRCEWCREIVAHGVELCGCEPETEILSLRAKLQAAEQRIAIYAACCNTAGIDELHQRAEGAERDKVRLDWLEGRSTQIDWADDDGVGDRSVHEITGGRNDREWHERGRGQTVRIAIDAAIAQLPKEAN